MTAKPAISVLMPVYNAEKTLLPAIWSVLNQSFEDFELLFYLDGCTDKSAEIISHFNDNRIKIFAENENKGIVFSRNFLAQKALGKYIAWLDADDLMLPERLSTQCNYLEVHPEIFILGSWVQVRNDKKAKQVKWPADWECLKTWILFRNPLVQSSLMLRNEKGKIAFDPAYEYLEDYAFYSSIHLQKHIAIYPAFLTSYYQDNQQALIHKYRKYDFVGKLESIMKMNLAALNISPNNNEIALLREFLRSNHPFKKEELNLVLKLFKNILKANIKSDLYNQNVLLNIVLYHCFRLLKNNGFSHFQTWKLVLSKPLNWISALNVGAKIK